MPITPYYSCVSIGSVALVVSLLELWGMLHIPQIWMPVICVLLLFCVGGLHLQGRLGRLFSYLTPHFWILRSKHALVAAETQKLLPYPYDLSGLEIALRSEINGSRFEKEDAIDVEWEAITSSLNSKALESRFALVGAIEMVAYGSHDVYSAFSSIDHDIYAAVGHRAGEAVASLSDLSSHLSPDTVVGKLQIALHGVSTGELSSLKGSLGEQVLLRHLQNAGVDITLGEHNQPGWDMIWGGHEVNAKMYGDFWDLSQHFSHYSDIPVVVPGDIAHIPVDAIHFDSVSGEGLAHAQAALELGLHHVFVDDALSNEALSHQAQHAENLITGHDSAVHGHLPFITMALSGFREFNLLAEGKTDVSTAARNAALDVAGTGVGGTVGAKVGGLVGTFIWPGVGTFAGMAIGGVLGAKNARKFTGSIKEEAFKDAWSKFESVQRQVQSEAARLEEIAALEFNALKTVEQKRLASHAQKSEASIIESKEALESWIAYDSVLHPESGALEFVEEGLREVNQLDTQLGNDYRRFGFLQRYVWPNVEILAHQEARRFLKQARRRLKRLRGAVAKGRTIVRGELFSVLAEVGILKNRIKAYTAELLLKKFERDSNTSRYFAQEIAALWDQRKISERVLLEKLKALKGQIQQALAPGIRKLSDRFQVAKTEADKLGIKLEA